MLPIKTSLLPTASRFLDDDWNNLFNWSTNISRPSLFTIPPVNIQETPESYLVQMAAPGFSKEDFKIKIENSILTISAEKETSPESQDALLKKEFDLSSFTRTFDLDHSFVDDHQIEAKYQDGILTLHLPKREEAKQKPARLIPIS